MAQTLRSMTGFARVSAPTELGELQIELKSVNSRYLELFLRQPDELRATDGAVRQRLNATLGRGKVDVSMRLQAQPGATKALQFDDAVLHQLAMAWEHMSERVPHLDKVDPLALLRWPGVLRDVQVDEKQLQAQVLGALDQAVAALQASRADEGGRLSDILAERLQQIEDCTAQVRERLPVQAAHWREKLLERLKDVADMEPERRDQALVQFAQRADVDEELERLGSHVSEVRAALANGSPIGRKLDFYMQELNREANTLGSKSLDGDITRLAVEIKVLIEQMREQVQNIE